MALSALVAAGCSSPPSKEHDQAVAALTTARAAEAATYAPEELAAAQASLDKYDQAVEQRDYRQALSDAIDARDRGFEAARLAATAKSDARTELQTLMADTDALIRNANGRLAGTSGPRLNAAAVERLRNAARTANSALQETRTQFDAQHYREGLAHLQPSAEELKKAMPGADAGRRGRGTR
jgi:methionyl-tRNA synthetase